MDIIVTPMTLFTGAGLNPKSKILKTLELPKQQSRLRSGLNSCIYSFDPSKHTSAIQIKKTVHLICSFLDKLDFKTHAELPTGFFEKGGPYPEGFVFYDINNVLV